MTKNELEVTIGWMKIRASGLAAVIVLALCGMIAFGLLTWAGGWSAWM